MIYFIPSYIAVNAKHLLAYSILVHQKYLHNKYEKVNKIRILTNPLEGFV
ncbi:hypothetical protein ASZ90_017108 [hydrocarbon metagenome]|uniref:Uncharacterized protein n=1 Tax=hydrocarbon metagenome TaxID=938273 RepID=A0A0W8E9V3_9ZZZZ